MASYNKVLLMGNLTRDPQLTYLPSNTPVVEIGLACNRKFKRQDGEMGEEVLFVDCRAFARTAEVINQYFKKGQPIFIEGRLQLDQWQDKEGNKRSKHRVHIDSFQFVGSKEGTGPQDHGDGEPDQGGHGGQRGQGGGYNRSRPGAPPPQRSGQPPIQEPAPEMEGEDIPF